MEKTQTYPSTSIPFSISEADTSEDGSRGLALLLRASNALSSCRNRDELLETLSRHMAEAVASAYCKICLLEEASAHLSVLGYYAVRDLGWNSGLGQSFPMTSLKASTSAVEKKEPSILLQLDVESSTVEPERSLIFHPQARSALLMPLVAKDRCLGIAVLGEMRTWERTPFTSDRIELGRAMAQQGAIAIENLVAFDAIAVQNRQMQQILDSLADGVFCNDLQGRITVFNRAAEKLTGYPASELIGLKCSGKFSGRDAGGCPLCGDRCPLERVLAPEHPESLECKESITRADGKSISIIHNVAPLLDHSNRVVGTVSVIRDESPKEELIRLQSDLVSFISHQLRTPLATISAYAELLTMPDIDTAFQSQIIHKLNDQCQRLSQLANQVLEFRRLETGRIDLALEPLTLVPLIQQTAEMYRSLYDSHQIEITAPDHLPFALGDRNSVMVVMDNLVENAIKHSNVEGTLSILIEEDTSHLIVTVADHGAGIPSDQLDLIFEPFHRVPRTADTQINGFGLGLHISKALVEAQGGRIWVESEPGAGARFHFTLQKLTPLTDGQNTNYR